LILGLFEWLLKQASLHHHDQQAPPKKTPSQNRKKEAGQPENTRADLSFKAIIKSPNRAGKDEKTDTHHITCQMYVKMLIRSKLHKSTRQNNELKAVNDESINS
jgi:hypothetical protein